MISCKLSIIRTNTCIFQRKTGLLQERANSLCEKFGELVHKNSLKRPEDLKFSHLEDFTKKLLKTPRKYNYIFVLNQGGRVSIKKYKWKFLKNC